MKMKSIGREHLVGKQAYEQKFVVREAGGCLCNLGAVSGTRRRWCENGIR